LASTAASGRGQKFGLSRDQYVETDDNIMRTKYFGLDLGLRTEANIMASAEAEAETKIF